MKTPALLLLLCFTLTANVCSGQNLVPNPSFEQYDTCPTASSQLTNAAGWTINVNTSDYFNACAISSSQVAIPNNAWGEQTPFEGNAYSGFYAYVGVNQNMYNEFMGGELLSSLVVGTKYYISFRISLADLQSQLMCGVDKIGMLFTNEYWGDTIVASPSFAKNYAHCYSYNIISDTASWTTVKGTFIADSAYRYFMIGHFFDSLHTQFGCLDTSNKANRWAYYFVDDVCVSPDSAQCDFVSGMSGDVPLHQNELTFLNPVNDRLLFPVKNIYGEIFELNGTSVMKFDTMESNEIDLSKIGNGIYLLVCTYKGVRYTVRQVIIH